MTLPTTTPNPAPALLRPAAPRPGARAGGRAFSLIELMLAVSLMSVIVLALYGMFHHTQRALHSNVTQVDVLEAGRAAMDSLTRELAQASPSNLRGGTNLVVGLSDLYRNLPPVAQRLPGPNAVRTNLLDDVYFLSRYNRDYFGTVYRVLYASNGVGVLCRFSTNTPAFLLSSNHPSRLVFDQAPTNLVRLADGVIHFRVRVFDGDGLPMDWWTRNRYTNLFFYTNVFLGTSTRLAPDVLTTETRTTFLSNALPAWLEVELGILEPRAVTQLRAFPANSSLVRGFLSNRVAQVQLFRQRIPLPQSPPIRTALR